MDLLEELLGALDAAAGRARVLGAWQGDKARPVIAASLLGRAQGALAVHLTGDVAPLASIADEEVAKWYARKVGSERPAVAQQLPLSDPAATAPAPASESTPTSAPASAPAAGGAPRRWTPDRIEEARTMRANRKASGAREYMKQTAEHYGVSPQFLYKMLGPDEARPKPPPLTGWPLTKTTTHRAK